VVLTGAGGSFCAGGDIRSMTPLPEESAARMEVVAGIAGAIARGPKPVLAAVEGVAFGLAMSLAASCDHVVAACCSATSWDAGEAAAPGLADVLCEPGSARQEAVRPAGRLAEGAASSIAETKRILASWPAELDAVLAQEVRAQPQLPAGANFAEGSAPIEAGRAPRFTGPTTTERA
jgi:enoyl-CoA hydratase/carnithine racemase